MSLISVIIFIPFYTAPLNEIYFKCFHNEKFNFMSDHKKYKHLFDAMWCRALQSMLCYNVKCCFSCLCWIDSVVPFEAGTCVEHLIFCVPFAYMLEKKHYKHLKISSTATPQSTALITRWHHHLSDAVWTIRIMGLSCV